jgi:uncharacterized protein YoxC
MAIETSISIIAIAFVILAVILVGAVIRAQRDLNELSAEARQLMRKLDALTDDIKAKSESVDFLFQSLGAWKQMAPRKQISSTAKELMELATVGLVLFEKIKAAVRHYAK